jgi:hypothetical protein
MDSYLADALIFFGILVGWIFFVWLAQVVAPEDRTTTFLWLAVLFGPIAILAAAVASPRDPDYYARQPRGIAKGAQTIPVLPLRCGVRSS